MWWQTGRKQQVLLWFDLKVEKDENSTDFSVSAMTQRENEHRKETPKNKTVAGQIITVGAHTYKQFDMHTMHFVQQAKCSLHGDIRIYGRSR